MPALKEYMVTITLIVQAAGAEEAETLATDGLDVKYSGPTDEPGILKWVECVADERDPLPEAAEA